MKKTAIPFIMLIIFEIIAITLWLTKDNNFYLCNFTYIGVSILLPGFRFDQLSGCIEKIKLILNWMIRIKNVNCLIWMISFGIKSPFLEVMNHLDMKTQQRLHMH